MSISRVWDMPHLRAQVCLALNERWILRAKANHRKLIPEKKKIKKKRERDYVEDCEFSSRKDERYRIESNYLTVFVCDQIFNQTSITKLNIIQKRNKQKIYLCFLRKKELLLGRHSHNLKTGKNYSIFHWNDETCFFLSVFVFFLPQANKKQFCVIHDNFSQV